MLRTTIIAATVAQGGALTVGFGARAAHSRMSAPSMDFFSFSANKIDGTACSMEEFKGKPTLILNVASL